MTMNKEDRIRQELLDWHGIWNDIQRKMKTVEFRSDEYEKLEYEESIAIDEINKLDIELMELEENEHTPPDLYTYKFVEDDEKETMTILCNSKVIASTTIHESGSSIDAALTLVEQASKHLFFNPVQLFESRFGLVVITEDGADIVKPAFVEDVMDIFIYQLNENALHKDQMPPRN